MTDQYFKKLLHSRALKATSHRLNLLTNIDAYKSAMPYSAIQKAMKSMDRVTLYRTLESLKEKGIIHKAFQENNESYYAICGKKCDVHHHAHDHVHFKCVKCEAVTCEIPTQQIEILIPNMDIKKVTVYVEGVCNLCN